MVTFYGFLFITYFFLAWTWVSHTQLPFFKHRTKYIAIPHLTHRIYIRAKQYHESSIKGRTMDYDTWQKWYYNPYQGLNPDQVHSRYKQYIFKFAVHHDDLHYSFPTVIRLCKATFISIPDSCMDFDPFELYKHQGCQLKRSLFEKFNCYFISTSRAKSYFHFTTKETLTWIEADQKCKSIDSYLPVFNSRKDLNGLLYAARFLPVNHTFIGLRYNKVGEILHCKIICFCLPKRSIFDS